MVAAAVLVVMGCLHQSPTRQVLRRFEDLAALVSKSGPESPVQLAIKGQMLQEYFTQPAELRSGFYGMEGSLMPTDIASQTLAARNMFTTLTLRFPDVSVSFPQRDAATATLTARLHGVLSGGEAVEEIREMRCELRRVDRKWRFASCEFVNVLAK